MAKAVYDATVVFCRRFLSHDRRLTDQMVQVAGSGVRNALTLNKLDTLPVPPL